MVIWILITSAAALFLLVVSTARRNRARDLLERHSITVEELHALLTSDKGVLLLDVRQPLDLLAYPETLPGARRIPPAEVLANPSLIPKDRDAVVYCTCPAEKTSRRILLKALELHFTRIKFLRGGLAAWKAVGYPVEPYRESFSLHSSATVPPTA